MALLFVCVIFRASACWQAWLRLHREIHHRLHQDPFHVRYSPQTRAVAAGQYSFLTYIVSPVGFFFGSKTMMDT